METGSIGIGSAPPPAEQIGPPMVISIAARLDQLEAAIGEGHALVDGIAGLSAGDAENKQAAPIGAEACLDRCQAQMQNLITRLASVRDRVGQL